mmetsp:Transcript_47401/g.122629  ORF Transcript_47401/g.122629 Transcript_47401/m.122629 type:complete len:225 (+) Transcript_47401:5663-6337(+)
MSEPDAPPPCPLSFTSPPWLQVKLEEGAEREGEGVTGSDEKVIPPLMLNASHSLPSPFPSFPPPLLPATIVQIMPPSAHASLPITCEEKKRERMNAATIAAAMMRAAYVQYCRRFSFSSRCPAIGPALPLPISIVCVLPISSSSSTSTLASLSLPLLLTIALRCAARFSHTHAPLLRTSLLRFLATTVQAHLHCLPLSCPPHTLPSSSSLLALPAHTLRSSRGH